MSAADGNAVLVNALSSSVRSTLNGIETVPGLIRRVLEEGSWRSFTSPRGEKVEHDTFASFITTPPSKGLGKTVEEIVQIASDDEAVLAMLADALDMPIEDVLRPVRRSDGLDPVASDAHAFGAYAQAGGWLFGLMVARSVRPGGGRSSQQRVNDNSKVSATEFARRAGCSQERVMRFYKAWERGAEAGLVPGFEALTPGQEVTLPDPALWAEVFISYERGSDRRESIAQQAEVAGTSYAEALKVAERPSALRTAILGDAKTAETARAALADRLQDDVDLRNAMARTIARAPQLRRAVAAEARRAEQAEYVRKAVENGKVKTPAGQVIELPAQAREKAVEHLAKVEGPETAPDELAAAYDAIQLIVAEAVEADPDVFTREQRTKFRRALTSTAKSIESIDPDDLIAVADDELRENIIAVQRRINELAALVAPSTVGRLRAV